MLYNLLCCYTSGFMYQLSSYTIPASNPSAEAFPATNFERAIVSFKMAPGRVFMNYFILDLKPDVDESRLAAACLSLITYHALLRSSFVVRAAEEWHPRTPKVDKCCVGWYHTRRFPKVIGIRISAFKKSNYDLIKINHGRPDMFS